MIRPKFIVSALSGLALVIAVTFLASVVVEKVVAQTGSKAVSGYAWSSNIGWIQMETGQSSPVVVNSDGSFSGYGWSSNVGWLNFNPTGPYPAAPNHGVKIDLTTNTMSGWGRFLANGGGWDGWVNFDGVTYDPAGKKFAGYAWGADVVGWVDMSHVLADLTTNTPCDPATDPNCCPGGANCTPPCNPATDPNCCPGGANCNPTPTKFTLNIKVIGAGVVNGGPINSCRDIGGSGCISQITSGDSVSLTATADDQSATIAWSGDTSPSCSNSACLITMDKDRNITVNFSPVSNEPNPFDIDTTTCNGILGGACRLIIDCSTSGADNCKVTPYYSRTAIKINNYMTTENGGLDLSVVGGTPPYLSFVICTDKINTSSCSTSLSGSTDSPVYLRAILNPRQSGTQTNFTVNLTSTSGKGNTVPIKVRYNDPVIGE